MADLIEIKLSKQFCDLSIGLLVAKPIHGERLGFEFIVGLLKQFGLEKDLFEKVGQRFTKRVVENGGFETAKTNDLAEKGCDILHIHPFDEGVRSDVLLQFRQ